MSRRKKQWKRIFAGMMSGVMLAQAAWAGGPVRAVEAAGLPAGEITVNPQIHYQTLEGWGSSMCWWGNTIGSWGDQDFNGNGRQDREEIAELAFSPEYLNLNIVRYNVGGGDKEDTSIKRIEGLVPGWTVDMTGTADGTGDFNADAFYNKKTEEMNDAGQLWMLEQANEWRAKKAEQDGTENDIINEVFSNSPPYYMTNSGSSTGGVNAASNLRTDRYDDFALYMARAAKWIDNNLKAKFGTGVDFIEPMNEPDTNYWGNGSTKQEGCVFKPGAEQSNMLLAMQDALSADEFGGSLNNVKITGTDETALSNAINSFQKLTADAKNSMEVIGAHTYSGNDEQRHTLRKLAKSYDKGLWMSEITKGGSGHDHDSMSATNTKSQSEGIMADLKYMQPTAWVAWLVADSEYECLKFNENWGLIHCVFEPDGPVPDYHTNLVDSNGNAIEGLPGHGYWAVTKQFYTMMQYSKYLKAGYTMIEIGDSNMCAAISPDGKELVIVAQNFSGSRNTTVDLSAFENLQTAEVYRTSDEENCELVDTQDVSSGTLQVALPGNSVSTFVIKAETDVKNYKQMVEADIARPAEADVAVSDLNKFTYTGSWSGQATTDKAASAAFTFEGSRAVFYGGKGPDAGTIQVSVDGGAAQAVDLTAQSERAEAIIYDTGNLAAGKHTVTLSMTAESGRMSLRKAELISGEVTLGGVPTIRKMASHDGALVVSFDEVSGSGTYTVKYGTSEDKLDQSIEVTANQAVIKGLVNGTTYYIQVTDAFGGVSNVVSGVPAVPEGNVLYCVDVGTSSLYTPTAGMQFGRYNSMSDQPYGADGISGKNWGYIGDDTAAYYQDQGRWDSVRECASGLEYQFDLPAGKYNVTVAMKDPWNNGGRYTDLFVNGELKEGKLLPGNGVYRTYAAELAQDGALSVKAAKGEGNSKNNPMISFIIITEYDAQATAEVFEPELLSTLQGMVPELPETVKVKTVGGTVSEKAVTWEKVNPRRLNGADFTTVSVNGKVDGLDLEVSQGIQIVPENVQYFIDCARPDSVQFQSLKAAAGLKNDKADQAYTDGSWGYLMQANAYGGSNAYTYGWYDAAGDGSIQYKIPLAAGEYIVTYGFHDWWYANFEQRPMNLKAYVGSSVVDWGSCGTKADPKEFCVSKELALEANEDVTLSVEDAGKDAPILSWIAIQSKLDRGTLEALIEASGNVKRADYTKESLKAFDNAAGTLTTAVAEARKQLLRADAVQADIDRATASIQKVMDLLVTLETAFHQAIQSYTVADSEKALYTKESWEAYQKALKAATDLKAAGGYTEEKMQQAVEALRRAKEALKKVQAPSVKVSKITVSGTVKKLAKGKTAALKAAVSPANAANRAVQWKSSDTKVATVSAKGVVTGKAKGTATITASACDGSQAKGVYKITVVNHAVSKITWKSTTKGIAAGKKVTLGATVKTTGKTANKALAWKTSNSKYAAVSAKGVVSAKKAGAGKTVTITAQATDGSGKKATVRIKIYKDAVKKVSLKAGKKTVNAGKKITVKATVKTSGKKAYKALAWSVSNKKYATVNAKGVVSTKKAGKGKTVTVTAKATDGSGKKASIKLKIK